MSADVCEILDLDRYPVAGSGAARERLIAHTHEALQRDGCAVLKGFVHPSAIDALVHECDRVAVHGHRNFNRTNAYFTQDRPDLPAHHPLRRFYDRGSSRVTCRYSKVGMRCTG